MSAKLIFEKPEYLFDLRVRERSLRDGAITPEQIQSFLDALPDNEDAGEFIDLPEIEPSEAMTELATRKHSEVEDGQEELLTEEL